MSARQMARLRSLLEEKVHNEEETVEDDSEEVIDEPKHHVSFSVSLLFINVIIGTSFFR